MTIVNCDICRRTIAREDVFRPSEEVRGQAIWRLMLPARPSEAAPMGVIAIVVCQPCAEEVTNAVRHLVPAQSGAPPEAASVN